MSYSSGNIRLPLNLSMPQRSSELNPTKSTPQQCDDNLKVLYTRKWNSSVSHTGILSIGLGMEMKILPREKSFRHRDCPHKGSEAKEPGTRGNPKTNRVSMTRSLCLAVDQQDTAIVNILLVNGVRCDFEESDRPPPPSPFFHQCTLGVAPPLQQGDFIPPLVTI
ncbi:hypothetical protein GMDG_04943 [Pseudogymnoascus destructans 20631-21]|uniref:Uncharacterized protein n=1 Tax=Pseudogymnoascus destructans (strain ATCC MYA-4855 / 20631-21) TaxID=658429 RepID=L8GC97_PSED2|nr:hypothetical protein GMDG_04943 [Pseudogymnoascus destructans 20631-21]